MNDHPSPPYRFPRLPTPGGDSPIPNPDSRNAPDDCLFLVCDELASRFVLACLVNDDPLEVRDAMEIELAKEFDLTPERAGQLFDLALEVMHLKVHGHYHSSEAEIGFLIASVTGGLNEVGNN
ncbi:MAG: hypothetical protein KDM63_20240 [Verrucomicrobiae bacterium]|nr:hypothetical protein [Verrucomicrobiae bacterium]